MARISIEFPTTPIFSCELTVKDSDVNFAGHVGHDSVVTLMQEARVSFYHALGFKDEMSFEGSVGHVITDLAVVYKSEAFMADVLVTEIAIGEFSKYGFDLYYQLTNKASKKEVARGKTGVACFDFEKRKIATIPALLLQKLGG